MPNNCSTLQQDSSSRHVRCPTCDRYLCFGEFSLLHLKCPRCKLHFQILNHNGKLNFQAVTNKFKFSQ